MPEANPHAEIEVYPKKHRIIDVVGLVLTVVLSIVMAAVLGEGPQGQFVVGLTVFYGLFVTHGSLSGAFVIRRYNRKHKGRSDLQEIV